SASRGRRWLASSKADVGRWCAIMRVSVFGLGYVGSVTAACLADAGHDVVGVDVNPEKVAIVNAGNPPVVEPGLGELLARLVKSGRLKATTPTTGAVGDTDPALICFGTPSC